MYKPELLSRPDRFAPLSRLCRSSRPRGGEPLAALLHQTNQPVQAAAREMIVLELYRRGAISSGKAAERLGISRVAFIQHASRLGIAYLDMTGDEWAAEKAASDLR